MPLTKPLQVGDVIRNHSPMWYGRSRRVVAVHKGIQGHYTYRFIVIGGPHDGASSTTAHMTAQRLFAGKQWEWAYPPCVQLPERI